MKKIIMFDIREEERTLVARWAEEQGVQVEARVESLTPDNVGRVQGYDGLSLQAAKPLAAELYPQLEAYGIKQIAQRSVGFEQYDLDLAKKHGLIISNVPAYSPASIAEFAVTTALVLIRRLPALEAQMAAQDFRRLPAVRGRVLGEMTVGIVGTGRIGLAAARLFRGFGCQVLGYDQYPSEEAKGTLTYVASLEDLVSQADVISLHMPLTAENAGQFSTEMFKHFKAGSYLVNTARGQIVDTKALLAALDAGQLAGAALDTYEEEAKFVGQRFSGESLESGEFKTLLEHPKIYFTPHIAYYTDTAVKNIVEESLDAVLAVLETGDTELRVN